MAHALGMRATSLGASVLVLGLLVGGALLATYSVNLIDDRPDGPIVTTLVDTPPIIEPEPTRTDDPPPNRPTSLVDANTQIVPPIPDAEPTEVSFPVAQDPPAAVTVTNPHWTQTPRGLSRYYPRRALERGVEGVVQLDCMVSTIGALNCAVISETPANWGFGEAALRMSRDYRMEPAERGGAPVEGRYRMRIPFTLE